MTAREAVFPLGRQVLYERNRYSPAIKSNGFLFVSGQVGSREDGSAIDEMLRILHTLKGGARLAGQKRLGDLSHDLEQHLTEALQQGAPWPESLFLDVQSGFEGLQQELDLLRQRLSASLAGQEEAAPVSEADPGANTLTPLLNPIVAASDVPSQVQARKVLPFVQRAQEAAQEAAAFGDVAGAGAAPATHEVLPRDRDIAGAVVGDALRGVEQSADVEMVLQVAADAGRIVHDFEAVPA